MRSKDLALLGLLLALAAFLHHSVLWGGQVYFQNDLLHVNHPWRVMTAEALAQGRQPLWNPYSYFGLPLLGTMQTGQFHPLSLVFDLLDFERALGLFLLLNYALGMATAYLWLKRWGFGRGGCFAGAAVLGLGGYATGFAQNLNQVSAALHLPGFFLFWGSPWLLALWSALSVFAGYPVFWALSAAALFAVEPLWRRASARDALRSAGGILFGLSLTAAVLLPGLELASVSNRRGGLPLAERLDNSFKPLELAAFVHPALARAASRRAQEPRDGVERMTWTRDGRPVTFTFYTRYEDPLRDPTGLKFLPFKSCYIGIAASVLVLLGLAAFARARPLGAAGLLLLSLGGATLLLGSSTELSTKVWELLPPLRYLRGPGRFTYLAWAVLLPLAAAGYDRIRRKPWIACAAALLVAGELLATSWGFYPTAPRGFYRQRGPLVEFLQEKLGPGRYFQQVRQEVWAYMDKEDPSEDYRAFKRVVYDAYRQKLFGIGNGVFHLAAASGDYESLFPQASSETIEFLRDAEPAGLKTHLKWAGIRFWLGRRPLKGSDLKSAGNALWPAYEAPQGVSTAYWLPAAARAGLEAPFEADVKDLKARAVDLERPRSDRLTVSLEAAEPGILYLAEPFYPGWEAYVDGAKTFARRARGSFVMLDVPAGAVSVRYLYRPLSWLAGCLAAAALWSAFVLAGLKRIMNPTLWT